MFQNRVVSVLLYKKIFRKTFVLYVTVWLVRICTYSIKMRTKKNLLFPREEKANEKRIQFKSAFSIVVLCLSIVQESSRFYLWARNHKSKIDEGL